MAKVSIITPLYNGSKTLMESIQSVLEQDYDDWELILFDDGSTDGTQDIAKKLAGEFPKKIFYFEHKDNKNFGTAYTRNRAIELSNSEFIAFIDQDDIYYKNRLSYQINIFDKLTNCAMIWGPAEYWYTERTFKQQVGADKKGLKTGVYEPPFFLEVFLYNLAGTPCPTGAMIKRKCFNHVNGFEESIKGSEDIVLWLKLSHKFSIYYDDEVLFKYRRHTDSTLSRERKSGNMAEWDLVFYKWIIDFLKKTSGNKELIEEYEFSYYQTLKRRASRLNFIDSRKELIKNLSSYPELKKKFIADYLLDLILPFNVATKICMKFRFDWFKNS